MHVEKVRKKTDRNDSVYVRGVGKEVNFYFFFSRFHIFCNKSVILNKIRVIEINNRFLH